jgi:hypothetical protein
MGIQTRSKIARSNNRCAPTERRGYSAPSITIIAIA